MTIEERKLMRDEENRLEAIDDNGYVSNYWYDAAGERTVKTSGESEQMFVNGLFSGGSTETARFSAYVNPYMVVSQGGNYTKHIYIGSQRIVSKLGDLDSYGADPRRIEYAGANVDGASIAYANKYSALQQTIKDRYAKFNVEYYGKDNDDYVNGQGFCCDDAPQNAPARAPSANDNPELFQYYYHSDHLGSTSLITDLDGNVVQHVEYVPFGEVFIEERNNTWNTPYLFNAKELDEETGLYYYGARYYETRVSVWYGADPMQEKTPNISTYNYCLSNPVRYIDPTGMWVPDENGNLVAEKNDNAYTFAKYLNTDAKTAIGMLEEQGYTVNSKGILNLKIGDVFQVEHTTPVPESRESLSMTGNQVRNRAGSEFSKDLFENYWNGGGDVELSGKRFAGMLVYMKDNEPKASAPSKVTLSNGNGTYSDGTKRNVSFYSSTEYDKAFGTATVYYNAKGNVVGFYDYYDFDSKPWGQRSTKNEIITRAVEFVSPNNAKPFSIRYGQSKR
jgi:RHS repeat-associated protein